MINRSSITCLACLAVIVAAGPSRALADDDDSASNASAKASVLVTLAPLTEGTC